MNNGGWSGLDCSQDGVRERILRQGGAFSASSAALVARLFFPCGRLRVQSAPFDADAQLDELLPDPLTFLCFIATGVSSDGAAWLSFTEDAVELLLPVEIHVNVVYGALYFVGEGIFHFTLVTASGKRHGLVRLNGAHWEARWGASEAAYCLALDYLRGELYGSKWN